MSKSNDHYLGVIIEDTNNRVHQIQEALSLLSNVPMRLNIVEEKIDKLSKNNDAFFLALKATNDQVNNHEFRITKLETA